MSQGVSNVIVAHGINTTIGIMSMNNVVVVKYVKSWANVLVY